MILRTKLSATVIETDSIRCFSTVQQHPTTRCHQSSPHQIGRGPKAPRSYPSLTGEDTWNTEFLPEHNLLQIQRSDIQTETQSNHGITSVAHNSKPIIWKDSRRLLSAQPPPPFSVVQVRERYIYRDPRIPRRWVHYPPQQPGLQHQVHNGARARWQITLPRCLFKHQRGREYTCHSVRWTHPHRPIFKLQLHPSPPTQKVGGAYTHEASRSHDHPPWLSKEGDGPRPRLPEDQWVQTMDVQCPDTQATTEHYTNLN